MHSPKQRSIIKEKVDSIIHVMINTWSTPWGTPFTGPSIAILAILAIWSIIWKGIALWKSARAGSKVWFVVLLIVNTVGILEILYIYVFSRKKDAPAMPSQPH